MLGGNRMVYVPFELSCEELLVIRSFCTMTSTEIQLALARCTDLIVAAVLLWLPIPSLLDSIYQHTVVHQTFSSRIRIYSSRYLCLITVFMLVIVAFIVFLEVFRFNKGVKVALLH